MTTTLGERRLIGWCFVAVVVVGAVLALVGVAAGPEYLAVVGQAFRAVVEAVK